MLKYNVVFFLNFVLFIFSIESCTKQSLPKNPWQKICGRDEGFPEERAAIYRVRVPPSWVKTSPLPDQSIKDTTVPNCEFFVNEDEGIIHISIHTFPTDNLEERIPAAAQVARWRRQFKFLDAATTQITPEAHGGFAGIYFEGQGELKTQGFSEAAKMMAWSMQMDHFHYQTLKQQALASQEVVYFKQMRADYTIKAVGPLNLMDKHYQDLFDFATSFELIHPIPTID